MMDAEALMLRDAPVTPVYFLNTRNLVSPSLTGFVDNALDKHRKRFMCFKHAASRRGR
jgi:oligopeptide transport system substrate-binding protein